jgi:hypothetical protein
LGHPRFVEHLRTPGISLERDNDLMPNVSRLRRFLLGILTVTQCVKAGTIISTLDLWDGSNSICCFASNQGAGTMGETITAPAIDSLLTSFTLVIANNSSGPMPFRGYVVEWNGTTVTGPILYRSPVQFSSISSAFTAYTFTPNILLIPETTYILFAGNAETDFAAYPGNLGMAYLGTDINHGSNAYPGGAFRFLPKGLPVSFWYTEPWLDPTAFRDSSGDNDIPFSAMFSSVPESANFGKGVLGITALIWIYARKKRRARGAGLQPDT